MMNDRRLGNSDHASVKILPPLVLMAALALGFLLDFAVPISLAPGHVALAAGGALLVAVSVALVIAAARELLRARTAFDVRKPTRVIVDSGPFKWSRNPVYLSMTLLQLGIALLSNSLWIALLTIPLGSALCLAVIRPEERYLEQKFGDIYRTYRNGVRRWI